MRPALFFVALAVLAVPGRASAQFDPYADYNRARAYRHFLSSPYSVRTYSGTTPGYYAEGYTPYGYERRWRPPGYLHQRISPYGFESHQFVPGERRRVDTPAVLVPYARPIYVPYYGPGR
jgi:hypothetical protein